MLQFVGMVLLLGSWAVLCRRSPLTLGLTSILLWVLVPGVAAYLVTGFSSGPLNIQPGALMATVALLVQVVVRPAAVVRVLQHRWEWTILLAAVSLICLGLGVVSGRGADSIAAALDQVVGPVALFYLLGMAILDDDTAVDRIRAMVLVLAGLEAALALLQFTLQDAIFFREQIGTLAIVRQGSNRWMGTFDHPLVLSFYLVVALFLLAGVRRLWPVLLLTTLIIGGIVVTQSRVGVGFGALALVYLIIRSPIARLGKATLVTLFGVGLVFAVREGVLDLVLERVQDDSGSTDARSLAYNYFVDNAREFI